MPALIQQTALPVSALTAALLSGSVYGVDHSGPGLYLRVNAEPVSPGFALVVLAAQFAAVPASTLANAALYGAVTANDQSGAGILRLALTALDHTNGVEVWLTLAGTSTRVWSLLDAAVLASFRVDGLAARSWLNDDVTTGELTIAGTSTRRWGGTELGDPEAFRINGVSTRAWALSGDRFRITGGSSRSWIAAIGVADECLTADGESATGAIENYVF